MCQKIIYPLAGIPIYHSFKNHWEEINFFRNIKPYILSKLNELLYTDIIQKINDDETRSSLSARDLSSDNIL